MALISAVGTFRKVSESSYSLEGKVITNPVGNGYKAFHKQWGKVIVLETGPNKGVWLEVIEVSGLYLPKAQESFKAPSKRPTYHDHM